MLRLRYDTPHAWLDVILSDFDAFLLDHTLCERKASALALKIATHYPDRTELAEEMVELAHEELTHFVQCFKLLRKRGLVLPHNTPDQYVHELFNFVRHGREEYFLDRLLVFAVIEARGCERFAMVAEALPPGELKTFYEDITRSEARHHGLFTRLARLYVDEAVVNERLDQLLDYEADLVRRLPHRPAVH